MQVYQRLDTVVHSNKYLLQNRELLPIVKKYKLEEETVESRKIVEMLGLPVGHSQLDSSERIWAQIRVDAFRSGC